MTLEAVHPPPPAACADRPSAIEGLGVLMLAGFKGAATALLAHTVVFGFLLACVTVWALQSVHLLRALGVVSALLTVHVIATVPITLWSALYAVGRAAPRSGVAHAVLRGALDRAGAVTGPLRDATDLAALGRSLRAAFDAMEREPLPSTGRWPRFRRFISRRVVRTVGALALKQLDLMPDSAGGLKYATAEEWLGARMDAGLSSAFCVPASRGIIIVFALQLLLSAGMLQAAKSLPPLWSGSSPSAPAVPFLPTF